VRAIKGGANGGGTRLRVDRSAADVDQIRAQGVVETASSDSSTSASTASFTPVSRHPGIAKRFHCYIVPNTCSSEHGNVGPIRFIATSAITLRERGAASSPKAINRRRRGYRSPRGDGAPWAEARQGELIPRSLPAANLNRSNANKPGFVSTRREAAFSLLVAALSVRSPTHRGQAGTCAAVQDVATPRPATRCATR